jgi:hypothetical protein
MASHWEGVMRLASGGRGSVITGARRSTIWRRLPRRSRCRIRLETGLLVHLKMYASRPLRSRIGPKADEGKRPTTVSSIFVTTQRVVLCAYAATALAVGGWLLLQRDS